MFRVELARSENKNKLPGDLVILFPRRIQSVSYAEQNCKTHYSLSKSLYRFKNSSIAFFSSFKVISRYIFAKNHLHPPFLFYSKFKFSTVSCSQNEFSRIVSLYNTLESFNKVAP